MTLLDHALAYARRGWPVFPVRKNKRSFVTGGVRSATTDPGQLTSWWRTWPNAGIAIPTGPVSGFFVLDVDGARGGEVSLDALALQHGPLPPTLTARTDGGARHLYLRWPILEVDLRNRRDVEPGLHVIADGYVVVPPSLFEAFEPYAWEDDSIPIADAPTWLLELLGEPAPREPVRSPKAFGAAALKSAVEAIARAPDTDAAVDVLSAKVAELAEHVRAGYLPRAQVESAVQLAGEQRGMNATGARALVALALGDAQAPVEAPADDAIMVKGADPVTLARAYLEQHCDAEGRPLLRRWREAWWAYEGGTYRELSSERARAPIWRWLARVHVATPEGPKKVGTSLSKVANVEAALTSLGTYVDETVAPPVWIGGDEGPRDVVVCANGLLDLATGDLAPHTPDLFSTGAIPVPWDARAGKALRWYRFLEQLFGDDWQSVDLLAEWFGYCLTGDTSMQKMLFIVGPKRSGKGTIARILTALIGRDRIAAPTLTGLAGPFGLAPLVSKPVGIIADARLRGRTDEAAVLERLLSITGEDSITIDRKNREALTVRLPTRLLLLSNELPRLSDASAALASRMLVLELRNSFYGQEDTDLEGKLLEELPSILAWAVEGWRALRERGRFTEPESSGEAHEELELLASPVARCVRAEFEVGAEEKIECGTAYARYVAWCKDEGMLPTTKATFGRDLRAAVPGLKVIRPRVGNPDRREFYLGLTTRSSYVP